MFYSPTLTKYTFIVTRREYSNLEFSRLLRILHRKVVTGGGRVPDPQQPCWFPIPQLQTALTGLHMHKRGHLVWLIEATPHTLTNSCHLTTQYV